MFRLLPYVKIKQWSYSYIKRKQRSYSSIKRKQRSYSSMQSWINVKTQHKRYSSYSSWKHITDNAPSTTCSRDIFCSNQPAFSLPATSVPKCRLSRGNTAIVTRGMYAYERSKNMHENSLLHTLRKLYFHFLSQWKEMEYDRGLVTVFEPNGISIWFKNCHHDHILFTVKGNGNIVFSVHEGCTHMHNLFHVKQEQFRRETVQRLFFPGEIQPLFF